MTVSFQIPGSILYSEAKSIRVRLVPDDKVIITIWCPIPEHLFIYLLESGWNLDFHIISIISISDETESWVSEELDVDAFYSVES